MSLRSDLGKETVPIGSAESAFEKPRSMERSGKL